MSKRRKTLNQKSLNAKVCAAVEKYNMIDENDKIAVAVSGGKDSVFLLYMLAGLQRYYRHNFGIVAITLDPMFNSQQADLSALQSLCDCLNVEYIIKRAELAPLIFDERKEKNPCSLCSKMRKGILNNMAKDAGCNKIALGHNYDDVIQTFFMNLFSCGKIGCFSPVSYLSRKELYMIRPLIFCKNDDIQRAVNKYSLPICKSRCPVDKHTNRHDTEKLICRLEEMYPDIRSKVMGALQRGKIDRWEI